MSKPILWTALGAGAVLAYFPLRKTWDRWKLDMAALRSEREQQQQQAVVTEDANDALVNATMSMTDTAADFVDSLRNTSITDHVNSPHLHPELDALLLG